jgi:eukaryotic-like serine/threonine-protein kinase
MKDAPIPDHIGRYQILERVGAGGMGVLYRGFDPKLDREVAIKVILTDFSEDAEQMRPRFYREAKATARLQHRNIVTVFEFVEDQNQPHIVMEFLRGVPLAKRIAATPPLTLDDKLDIVAQLCSGLGYAHTQGVVHRDVKPANVFLLEDGTVKLLDFGIAKLTTSTLTRQGDVLGSASYMSPEQVAGSDSVDGRADVWSTGVVLYELLAGRKPFEGETPTNVIVKILKEDPTPIETVVPNLPKQLISVVHRSLQKDPTKRIAKAEEFSRELQWIRKALLASGELAPMDETKFASTQVLKSLHEDLQKQPTGTSIPKTAARPKTAERVASVPEQEPSSKKWMAVAAVAAVVVFGVGGWAVFRGGSNPPPNSAPSNNSAPAPPAAGGNPGVQIAGNAPAAGGVSATTPNAPPPPAAKEPPVTAVAAPPPPKPAPPSETPAPPPTEKPKPAPAVMVPVTIEATFPFAVLDGGRQISAPATSHELSQPSGKSLTLSAPDFLMRQTVRVEGSPGKPFDFTVPNPGTVDVRTAPDYATCDVVIEGKNLGQPPISKQAIASGPHRIDIVCGGQTVKSEFANIVPGQPYVARILR